MKEIYEKKGFLQEDFRLFHLRDAQGTKVDYHYHEFYKLLFLVSGSGGYSIEGKRYMLKAGDIVLVGNQCVHRPEFEVGIPYERIILYISPDFLYRHSTVDCDLTEYFSGKYGHVHRPDEDEIQGLQGHFAALESAYADTRYGKNIVCNSILLQLLVEMIRGIKDDKKQRPMPLLPKSKRMQDIVKYLDAHLTEEISVDDLAEKFYLSRFHMMRRFKEETGTTIHNYVSERRLLLARDLMYQGYPATEACYQCGYRSYASFARAYGKLFGTTPTGRNQAAAAVEESYE